MGKLANYINKLQKDKALMDTRTILELPGGKFVEISGGLYMKINHDYINMESFVRIIDWLENSMEAEEKNG